MAHRQPAAVSRRPVAAPAARKRRRAGPANAPAAATGARRGRSRSASRTSRTRIRRTRRRALSSATSTSTPSDIADAIKWYEKALALDPTNPDVSTDLGVSYYYTNQPDKALAQFQHSLEIDPKHTKTMLNQGIVLAFGKQDLGGADKAWQRVVELAPDSPEGQAAKRALDSHEGCSPNLDAGTASTPGTE